MRKLLFSPFSVDQVSVHLYKKNRYQRLFVFEASLTFIIIITHNYTHTIVYKLLGLIINKKTWTNLQLDTYIFFLTFQTRRLKVQNLGDQLDGFIKKYRNYENYQLLINIILY